MNKYKIIERIVTSKTINEDDKVYHIEMFLKGWSTEEDLKWIWE